MKRFKDFVNLIQITSIYFFNRKYIKKTYLIVVNFFEFFKGQRTYIVLNDVRWYLNEEWIVNNSFREKKKFVKKEYIIVLMLKE